MPATAFQRGSLIGDRRYEASFCIGSRRVHHLYGDIMADNEDYGLPLSREIQDFPMSKQFKLSMRVVKIYDGTTDPNDFLHSCSTSQVKDLLYQMFLGAFINGLRPGEFYKKLRDEMPTSERELQRLVE